MVSNNFHLIPNMTSFEVTWSGHVTFDPAGIICCSTTLINFKFCTELSFHGKNSHKKFQINTRHFWRVYDIIFWCDVKMLYVTKTWFPCRKWAKSLHTFILMILVQIQNFRLMPLILTTLWCHQSNVTSNYWWRHQVIKNGVRGLKFYTVFYIAKMKLHAKF